MLPQSMKEQRRQFWRDAFLAKTQSINCTTSAHAVEWADDALKEFDRRFNLDRRTPKPSILDGYQPTSLPNGIPPKPPIKP